MREKITYGWVIVVLAVVAGVLTVALTGVAFWLSYEHLHDVAGAHGLPPFTARSWAWPATLDTFIVIGEVLILRASLLGKSDWWAVFLVAAGSGGSITLNVTGVGGDAGALDYTVAAVPPVAALLAFMALMRQLHGMIKAYLDDPVIPSMPIVRPPRRVSLIKPYPAGPVGRLVSHPDSLFIREASPVSFDPRGIRHAPVVYFIRNGSRVKIGTSRSIVTRIEDLSLRITDVLIMVHGDRETEREFHSRFASQRVGNTEWFELRGELSHYLREQGVTLAETSQKTIQQPAPASQSGTSQKAVQAPRTSRKKVSLIHPGRTSQVDTSRALLTTKEAAQLAGVPDSTIRTWKQRKKLVPVHEDPDVLYSRDSVLARMAEVKKP